MTGESSARRKQSGGWPIYVYFGIFLVLIAFYVLAYLRAPVTLSTASFKMRIYSSPIAARVFVPAAWIESRLLGSRVSVRGLHAGVTFPGTSSIQLSDYEFIYTAEP